MVLFSESFGDPCPNAFVPMHLIANRLEHAALKKSEEKIILDRIDCNGPIQLN